MKQTDKTTAFTFWANRILMAIVAILVPSMPLLLKWYNSFRPLADRQNLAIIIAFYFCVPIAEYALWNLDKLLGNILQGHVFVFQNVSRIRRVCICCCLVSLTCLPAAYFYAPLIFMSVIMGFLCPVVNVVRQVMQAAVEIREENDLTV